MISGDWSSDVCSSDLPSRSSQGTSPKYPVSCIEPGLAIHFTYHNLHVSMPFSHIIPPRPLPQSPKDCSIHLFLFCCLAYRVIVTIFLQGELSLSIFRQGNLIALQMLQDSVIEDGNKEHIPEVTEDQSCIAQGPEVIVVFSFS